MVPAQISLDLINKVRAAKRVFFHSGCPDGIMAREFVIYLMSDGMNEPIADDVEFVPYNPGTVVELSPNTVFIDVSPVADQWKDFLDLGVVILDHHNTVLPLFEQYQPTHGHQLVFGDTAATESGAWIGYKMLEVWAEKQHWVTGVTSIKLIAELIAIGDCWDTSNPGKFELARYVGQYLALYGNDFSGIPGGRFIDSATEYGKLRAQQVKRASKRFMARTSGGLNVAFFNTPDGISDIAEIVRNENNMDLIVSWYSHCIKVDDVPTEITSFSLRSNDKFDCGKFAKFISLNGGGHKKAAGFQTRGVINGMDYVLEALKWFGVKGES